MKKRKLQWDLDAWEDYLYWQKQDKKTVSKINRLIKDVLRTPFEGLGEPEALKNRLSGYWSRRIDGVNRLVYLVEDEVVVIMACKGHYDD